MRRTRVAVVAALPFVGISLTVAGAMLPPPAAAGLPTSLGRFAATRSDSFSVEVYDETTGRTYAYRPNASYDNASIVKVNILESVLWGAQRAHRWLSSWEQQQAVAMIRQSDNDAATRLWKSVGGARGVAAYDREVGLQHTSFDPGGHWGLTVSTVADQVALMRAVVTGRGPLNLRSRAYVTAQMQRVEPDQRWGITAGVPSTATIHIKNGWLPRATHGWRVNSIGRVHGSGRTYDIAVLSTDNGTMGYGVASIEGVSRLVFKALAPAPTPARTPSPSPSAAPPASPSASASATPTATTARVAPQLTPTPQAGA